jgi:hypothetical protein
VIEVAASLGVLILMMIVGRGGVFVVDHIERQSGTWNAVAFVFVGTATLACGIVSAVLWRSIAP